MREIPWHRSEVDIQTEFRQLFCYPIIDYVIFEINRRLSDYSLIAMIGIQSLTLKHKLFLNYDDNFDSFSLLYSSNVEDLNHEMPYAS